MSYTHIFSVVLSLSVVLMPALAVRADLPMTSGVPQSCGVQLKTHNFNIATIDQVNEVGFSTFRRGVYWYAVEKEKGVYNFDKYQEEFDHAKSKGMRILGCLFGNNKLYEDDGRGGIQTQAGREGFANFAAAVAKHFKDYDIIWEVWNEPNIRTFWRKDGTHNSEPFAQEYVDLVKTIMPVMLKADPDVFVMVGSVSNYWEPSYQWTEYCFAKGILETGIKAWSVHPYGVRTPEEFSIGHDITRNLLEKYGHADMIMLNSERGFAVKKPKTQLELEGWSGGREVELRKYQAWHFVRQFMLDQFHDVRLTIWYEWDGDTFGMMTPDQSRPILTAAKVMIKQLNGYQLTRRITTENHCDYLLLWENDKGHRQLVAWTSPAPGGFPDEALVHDVTIDTNSAGSTFVITDIDGKTTTANQLKLSLSGSPQYVAIPAGVELGKITTAKPAPAANDDNQSLDLFTSDANWKFIKNTGEGSFTVAKDADGTPIGVAHFDFTNPGTKSTPYVISLVKVNIPSGDAITLNARTALAQKLTFRVSDSTGQTLQYKTSLQGGRDWETIRIPLNRKLEHWGGANDGKVHFPITSISMNIPRSQKEQLAGKVEYANAMIVGGSGSAVATPQASTQTAGTTEGDLKLFAPSVTWKFLKNTGQGSFKLQSLDGVDVGVLEYDFTQSTAKSTPYVLAGAPMVIGKGATGIIFKAKSDVAQKLTFRVTDSTGQTLQYKTKINGIGDWETIRIPLDRKLEHWGGANDGFVSFPTKHFYISVPRPSPEHLQGTVLFSQITAE
ncbi:MAG: hypothetical protein CMJ19_01220 [Phycisphaeraceae bacterium]|nr:hypothetical protein [Phycisphaeraceae bacterium]